jgi:hypothetical protein
MPDTSILMYACVLLSAGVFGIAAASIGIQAFNNCADWKNKKAANFKFLVTVLVFAILSTLISFGGMYTGITKSV